MPDFDVVQVHTLGWHRAPASEQRCLPDYESLHSSTTPLPQLWTGQFVLRWHYFFTGCTRTDLLFPFA